MGLGPSVAIVAGEDAFDDGQANAGAFELIRAMEALEDGEEFGGVLHIEADPVVFDEINPIFGIAVGADFDGGLGMLSAELECIIDEISEDLTDHGGVADGWQEGIDDDPGVGISGVALGLGNDGLGECAHIDYSFGQADAGEAGESEEILDQPVHLIGAAEDDIDAPFGVRGQMGGEIFDEDAGEPFDGAEWGTQVMGDRIGKGFQFVISGGELGGAIGDAPFQFSGEGLEVGLGLVAFDTELMLFDGDADGEGEPLDAGVGIDDVIDGAFAAADERTVFVGGIGQDNGWGRSADWIGQVEQIDEFGIEILGMNEQDIECFAGDPILAFLAVGDGGEVE